LGTWPAVVPTLSAARAKRGRAGRDG